MPKYKYRNPRYLQQLHNNAEKRLVLNTPLPSWDTEKMAVRENSKLLLEKKEKNRARRVRELLLKLLAEK